MHGSTKVKKSKNEVKRKEEEKKKKKDYHDNMIAE